MFKKSIRSRVMTVINERIESAQKSHDEQLKIIEQRHEAEKSELADVTVDRLIGQFTVK